MTPTEYQKGKYRSLVKELPELERQVAKQNILWLAKALVLFLIASIGSEILVDKLTSDPIRPLSEYFHWKRLLGTAIFWGVMGYFMFVHWFRSEYKRKKKELAELTHKFPQLQNESSSGSDSSLLEKPVA